MSLTEEQKKRLRDPNLPQGAKSRRSPAAPKPETPPIQEPLDFDPEDMQGALLAPVVGAGRDMVLAADECFSQIEKAAGAAIARRRGNFISNVIGYSVQYSQEQDGEFSASVDKVIGEVDTAIFQCPEFTSAPFTRPRMAGSGGNRALLAAEPTNQPTSTQPPTN